MGGPQESRKPVDAANAYYYSSGKRVDLVRDPDLFAVDLARLDADSLGGVHFADAPRLRGDIILVDRTKQPGPAAAQLARLVEQGKALDVFNAGGGGAKIVVMPEVHIEVDQPAKRQQIKKLLAADRAGGVTVESPGGGRYRVKVGSGKSGDALKLANEIWEAFKPAVSHPRFLRIVPKPHTYPATASDSGRTRTHPARQRQREN